MSDPSLIENSISLPNGVRAIARRNGIEVRTTVNAFSEEIICNIEWSKIDHLKALTFDSR